MTRWRFITLACCLGVLAFPQTTLSRTWYVEQDGSGQFTVIQDAVDVAASGDTIMIGPGHYTEYTVPITHRIYVNINYKGNLTFLGAGTTQTIIGPVPNDNSSPYYHFGIVGEFGVNSVVIRDIQFWHLTSQLGSGAGISVTYAYLEVSNCSFIEGSNGIIGHFPQGGFVENCRFENGADGILSFAPTNGMTVRNCEFIDFGQSLGFQGYPATDCLVESCTFTGGHNGCQFNYAFNNILRDCYFENQSGASIIVLDYCSILLEDNIIEQYTANDHVATGGLRIAGFFSQVSGQGNLIVSNRKCIGFDGFADFDFHGNHFIRGSDDAWYVRVFEPFQSPEYHADLTDNYWGTTDVNEISAWIYDGYDSDVINLYVDFEPIAGGPVSVESYIYESKTWGGVKVLYR